MSVNLFIVGEIERCILKLKFCVKLLEFWITEIASKQQLQVNENSHTSHQIVN